MSGLPVRRYQFWQFCVARLAIIPCFSRCSIASRILTRSHQLPRSQLSTVEQILSLTWTLRRLLGDFLGTLRVASVSRLPVLRLVRILRLPLPWLAKDNCLIIPGHALTLPPLFRFFHPLLQSLKLNCHSLKTEILQDLILIPDQLTSQLSPPDTLRIRSILRLCILVRSLDQILNRLNHDLPLRLTPSIDTLPNLRPLILAHCNLHHPTT